MHARSAGATGAHRGPAIEAPTAAAPTGAPRTAREGGSGAMAAPRSVVDSATAHLDKGGSPVALLRARRVDSAPGLRAETVAASARRRATGGASERRVKTADRVRTGSRVPHVPRRLHRASPRGGRDRPMAAIAPRRAPRGIRRSRPAPLRRKGPKPPESAPRELGRSARSSKSRAPSAARSPRCPSSHSRGGRCSASLATRPARGRRRHPRALELAKTTLESSSSALESAAPTRAHQTS
jgi:hypothetical protein